MYDVIVVGGGAAGLMAAGTAASRGLKVLLIEKNDRIGKKILISGKGRCNITNNTDVEGLIENTPGNGTFLYSAFYTFSNMDLINLLNRLGLETKVERGGRVFPVSDKAKDVVDVLYKYVRENGAEIRLNTEVKSLEIADGRVTGVRLSDDSVVLAGKVIICTGGMSYPGTGSTGDGYVMAKTVGHRIVDLKPSLVALLTKEEYIKELQGLSLRNIEITVTDKKGRKVYSDFGELLFTHFGLSGPVILSASRHILPYGYKDVKIAIDLKPALDEAKLDSRIQRDFEEYSRKQFKNSLDDLLPQKLIPVIIKLSQIPPDKFVNQITKTERHNLVMLLKHFEATVCGARSIKEAIVTAGGVDTREINPSTMESKITEGLFFAGEVIDVDAYTGGFNLTIAFSTGYLAGMNC